MRGKIARALVVATLFTALPAGAAPRLAVGPVRGDSQRALARQLERALCGTFDCVRWDAVSRKGKLDLALARKARVAGALTGAVSRSAPRVLSLDLFTRGAKPAQTWRLPVSARGLLDADSLDLVRRELGTRFGVAPPPPAPPPPPPVAAPRAVAPVPLPPPPAAAAPAPSPPATPPPAAVAPARREVPPPEPQAAPAQRQWLVAAELGGFFAKRDLTYSGAAGPLLEHHVPGAGGPAARLELFPAASGSPWLRGLGLSAEYARTVMLETKDAAGTKVDTTGTRLAAALLWRAPPLGAIGLVLVPSAGWESRELTVSPAIAGLPNAKLTGVRGGLALEIPLSSRFTLLADLAYLRWLTAKELVKGTPAFFGGGSAWGLDVAAGVAARLFGPVSLRVFGGYGLTRYSLESPAGAYAASGAKDAVLRGSCALRAEL